MADIDSSLPVGGKFEVSPTTYVDGDNGVPLLVDVNGRLQVDVITGGGNNDSVVVDDTAFTPATSSITTVGYFADETTPDSVDEGDVGAARMTLDRKQLMVLVDPTTDANRLVINASGEVGVVQATHDDLNLNANMQIGDTDVSASVPVPVSATEAANAESNPIFVQVVSGALSGIEVVDYDTAAAVAKDATSNHDLTVTASNTLKVQCCLGAASGAQKIEVQAGPVAGLISQAVTFTSSANPHWLIDFKGLLEVDDASTGTLRIIRTNRDNQAQDLYSTILATEIPD